MTVLAQVGKFFISVAYAVIYVYVAELFPSSVRSSGMSICITFGKTANIAAPFVVQLVRFKFSLFYALRKKQHFQAGRGCKP